MGLYGAFGLLGLRASGLGEAAFWFLQGFRRSRALVFGGLMGWVYRGWITRFRAALDLLRRTC